MNRFWKGVIKPIIQTIRPINIIEIGAANGLNSVKILEYCASSNSRCEIIDPLMPRKLEENKELLKEHGTFHQALSLEVLPNVKGDLYLVDGDHNWYSVYNELKYIFDKNPFVPTVFFHDISWPYARRDMYYNPSNIPPEFVHPYDESKGIDIATNELKDSASLNRGLANAIEYGGSRNGVLTAIEDFIEDRKLGATYEFLQLPILNGLGLLIAKEKLSGPVGDLVSGIFRLSPNLLQVLNVIETERLKHMRNYLDCIQTESKGS